MLSQAGKDLKRTVGSHLRYWKSNSEIVQWGKLPKMRNSHFCQQVSCLLTFCEKCQNIKPVGRCPDLPRYPDNKAEWAILSLPHAPPQTHAQNTPNYINLLLAVHKNLQKYCPLSTCRLYDFEVFESFALWYVTRQQIRPLGFWSYSQQIAYYVK